MRATPASLSLIPVLCFVPGVGFGDTKSPLDHIATLKMSYSENWYSYNFVVCANDETIQLFDIVLTSDLQTKHFSYEKFIENGNCVSFGMMIHAINPELIFISPVWIQIFLDWLFGQTFEH